MNSATLRRAAILLSSLPPQAAAKLLAQMGPEQVRRVRAMMSQLDDVDPLERRRAVNAFMANQRTNPSGTDSFESFFAPPAPAADRAGEKQETESGESRPPSAFQFLESVPDDQVIDCIIHEGPQTMAVVLAGLPPRQASRLLARIPKQHRAEVVRRLATLDLVPPESIEEIAETLHQVLQANRKKETRGDGPRALLAMISNLDPEQRDSVLSAVDSVDPLLSATLRENAEATAASRARTTGVDAPTETPAEAVDSAPHQVPAAAHVRQPDVDVDTAFEQLQELAAEQLRTLLAQLPGDVAVLALCGFQPESAEAVLAQLDTRRARSTRRRMIQAWPVSRAELNHAKHLLVKVARREGCFEPQYGSRLAAVA